MQDNKMNLMNETDTTEDIVKNVLATLYDDAQPVENYYFNMATLSMKVVVQAMKTLQEPISIDSLYTTLISQNKMSAIGKQLTADFADSQASIDWNQFIAANPIESAVDFENLQLKLSGLISRMSFKLQSH